MAIKLSEKMFENRDKAFLEGEGAWFVKTWSNGVQRKGIPDILACVNGYFVGIETKADTGTPSELQLWNVEQIRRAGGFAFVLYPSGFHKFQEFILDLKVERFTRDMEVELR